MEKLNELLKERMALESKIKKLEDEARQGAIATAKQIISEFNINPYELFKEISIRIPPRFINPDTGESWSGRGKTPRWLQGKTIEEIETFRVIQQPADE